MLLRNGVQPNRTSKTSIVVEVMHVRLLLLPRLWADSHHARWHSRVGKSVVDGDRQAERLASSNEMRDVRFERRVTALVLDEELIVDVDASLVSCGISPNQIAFPSHPASRHDDFALVDDPSDMIMDRLIGEDVVVGSRDGAFEGLSGERSGPGSCFVCFGCEGELPEAVEVEEVS